MLVGAVASAEDAPVAVPDLPSPPALSGRALVERLLPPRLRDRSGWADDLQRAVAGLGLPQTREHFCAAIAVIEQESGFQADPVVPGLPRIVRREIDRRVEGFGVPPLAVDVALLLPSPDGRSFRQRLAALRTERQVSELFEEMLAELPQGREWFGGYNPVRTGGPMQVSIGFAETQVREKPYPYARSGNVRREVFTRHGGVYFGVANLLDYPVDYPQMLYRFADFNAGRYSSRNAAFQSAVMRVSGQKLALDGDLLRYRDGRPMAEAGATQRALDVVAHRLGLTPGEVRRDLLLEKSASFSQSPLYRAVFARAEASAGKVLPREILPQIRLQGPKIQRRLTTEWFARRVDGRYRGCLARFKG